jgi:hypothetical protein
VLARRAKRPRYGSADRAFLAAVSRFLPRERWSAFGVVPDTLKRWRRQLESRRGSRRRRGPGRPPIDAALRELILRMGRENPRWGYLRIKGELLKLSTTVSATTIANVLRRGGLGPAPRRIGPTWGDFLRVQALTILSTGSSASGLEDRGRPESGHTLAASEPRGRVPLVEACCHGEASAAADRLGDPEPGRELPFLVRLHEPFRVQVVPRVPPGGARARDGPRGVQKRDRGLKAATAVRSATMPRRDPLTPLPPPAPRTRPVPVGRAHRGRVRARDRRAATPGRNPPR